MIPWEEFAQQTPHIAEVFVRRHQATRNLCLLGTIRSDGYPRMSAFAHQRDFGTVGLGRELAWHG